MKLLTVLSKLAPIALVVACAPKSDATDAGSEEPAPEPAAAAAEEAPAEAEAAEAEAPVDPEQEKQALGLTCAAHDAAMAEVAEDADDTARGEAFHAKAEASLAEAGLSMDIGVLGAIASAAAEDKAGLLAAAVERHGLQEACQGLSDAMASHPPPAAEGSEEGTGAEDGAGAEGADEAATDEPAEAPAE